MPRESAESPQQSHVAPRRSPVGLLGVAESIYAAGAAGLLIVLIYAGSQALTAFDSALVGYAVAIVALTFAVVQRFGRWLRMPSTRRYWIRGWQLTTSWSNFRRLPGLLPRAVVVQILGQGFIRRRGLARWIAHQCLFWGVIGATLITFPLVFGWLAFHLQDGTTDRYRVIVFGFPTLAFTTDSFLGWSIFRALAYTAVLVIIGCVIFFWRRFRDRAAMTNQSLAYDMAPLLSLLIISVTGLMLTASASLFDGAYYGFLVIIHMASVVLTLVFIPFGKFFHVLQRPASVGIQMYTELHSDSMAQDCSRCGEALASTVFLTDLRDTLDELGQDYRLGATDLGGDGEGRHLSDYCPRCKRVLRGQAYFAANGKGF